MFTYTKNNEKKTSNENIEWYKYIVCQYLYCFVDHDIFISLYNNVDELLCLYGYHLINKKNQDG
jgi:hypothetical protein